MITTDAQGRFVLKDLEAGSYRLFFYANGYVRQEYGQRLLSGNRLPFNGTPVNVAAGQTIRDVRISLTPAGNVNGSIRDMDGQPLAAVPVQIMKPVYNFRGERTLQSAGAALTDDRGEYRVYWVTPGRYYVLAGSAVSVRRGPMRAAVSPNEVPGQSVFPTYYPRAADLSDATTIDVRSGADLNGIDFVLERQQTRRIQGRVVDAATGRWPPAATVRLVTHPAFGGITARESPQNYNSRDGTFELRDVPPGSHEVVVEVTLPGAAAPPITPPVVPAGAGQVGILSTSFGSRNLVTGGGQVPVQVANADVGNLVVTIGAAASIPGRLIVEGGSTGSGADRLRVQLSPSLRGAMISSVQAPAPVAANQAGEFRLENVLPGEYRVQVAGLQADFYIKEVRFGSQDVLNTPLNFSGAGVPATLDVVVSTRISRIEGTITDDKSQAVRGVQAVLLPDQHRDRPDLFRNVTTDQNGRFLMEGVAPGDYKVFAWEALEQFAYYDPDFVRRYEQRGHPVNVSEASSQTVQVRLIPAGQ
jgi:hypothetical protein